MAQNEPPTIKHPTPQRANRSDSASSDSRPLYKRLGNVVIPPLQASFSFLSPGASTDESEEYPFGGSGASTPRDEDDDKASAIGELRPLNHFFNMITAALVLAPHAFLKQLRSGTALPESGYQIKSPAYGVFDLSDSESESGSESDDEGDSGEETEVVSRADAERTGERQSEGERASGAENRDGTSAASFRKSASTSATASGPNPNATLSTTPSLSATPTTSLSTTLSAMSITEPSGPAAIAEIANSMAGPTVSPLPSVEKPVLEPPANDLSDASDLDSHHDDLHSETSMDTFHDAVLRRLAAAESEKRVSEFESIPEDSAQGLHLLKPINSKELTVLQKSILENLDPGHINEGVLIVRSEQTDHSVAEEEDSEEFNLKKQNLRLQIADKLSVVFQLKDTEYFSGNYNAWLIKDVLLQGHIYLTHESLLFFSFLPKRYLYENIIDNEGGHHEDDSLDIIQCGTLGMRNPNLADNILSASITHRYWVILRPDTLSVYSSAVDLYFPTKVIDLKDCVSADMEDTKSHRDSGLASPRGASGRHTEAQTPRSTFDLNLDDEAEMSNFVAHEQKPEENPLTSGVWIRLHTKKKTYRFSADNQFSARKWVNNLTKVIFLLQNSNARNEVLFKIPIALIERVEKSILFNVANNSETDEEPTLSVSIIYDVGPGSSRLLKSKMKEKMKINGKNDSMLTVNANQRKIHLLFFSRGATFIEAISENMKSQDKMSDSLTIDSNTTLLSLHSSLQSERIINMARRKTAVSDHQMLPISTLKDSNSNLILEQVIVSTSSSPSTPLASTTNSESSVNEEPSTMKKIGKSLASPSRLFGRARSFSSTERPALLDVSGLDVSWQLPRKLSVEGLKSINFSFESSRRNMGELSSRYRDVSDATPDEYLKTKSEALSSGATIPTPLNFGDASEYERPTPNKLLGLKTFGKSIKAISTMSGIWSSNPNHYEQLDDDDPYFEKDSALRNISNKNFLKHFSFNMDKRLIASYTLHLQRSLPVYGKLYLGDSDLCFRSLLPGVSTKMILPLKDINNCYKEKGIKLKYSGLVLVVRGQDKYLLEFGSQKSRDDCETMILRQLERLHGLENWHPESHEWGAGYIPDDDQVPSSVVAQERKRIKSRVKAATRRRINHARIQMFEEKLNSAIGMGVPLVLEDSPLIKTEVKPSTSFKFTLLTIGSRGDVQPYLALAKGLKEEGHDVTIATHSEFKDWILKYNVKFKEIAGNPTELMALMVKHGTMSMTFIKEASAKFRTWISELLTSSWEACQGTDILIESPSAMGGVHIAEALGIPYMRAFTMPWTRTRAYPHAFIVPDQKMGGSYNYLTHVMFETLFWKGISGQVNKWRQNELGLPRTSLLKMQQTKIPFLYNISPSIFPPSVDFPDWVKVTGYWFLEEGGDDYEPPAKLVEFLQQAKDKGKKVVYIGFGSIVVKNAKSLTKAIVEAVQEADVYCILNKGWSDRLLDTEEKKNTEPEIELPPEVYNSGAIPHDWLFPRISAAVHHGGSGTTGATLRAGLPTIIKPFFGDQFFYASRMEQMGVGLSLKKLNAKSLTKALTTVVTDFKMIEKCRSISERITSEDGVAGALEAIYSELEYARHLSITRKLLSLNEVSGLQTPVVYEESDEDDSEDGYSDHSESDTDDVTDNGDANDVTQMEIPFVRHNDSSEHSSDGEDDVAVATMSI